MAISRARVPALLRSPAFATPVLAPRPHCSSLLPRFRFHKPLSPVTAKSNHVASSTLCLASSAPDSAGENVVLLEKEKGLATRLDGREQSQHGQQCKNFSFMCGAGVQDISAVTLFKSPRLICPSLSLLLSSHGSSGQIRCSSYSSVGKRSSSTATASVDSGDTQTIEQLWEEYFAGPFQWWDNRVNKRNSRSPDFKHKVTGKALWIDGWSTPVWVKAKLKSVAEVRLQSHATRGTNYSQEIARGKRQPEDNNGRINTAPKNARVSRQTVEDCGGSVRAQSASTLSGAIAVLKNRLQQGIMIDSYMYVEVLKRCLKQKDLIAAKQVHDCIIKSRMEQNIYVANNLLSVYIRFGRLLEARRVFDALVKKDVFSWNIMIGGYAQHNHAKDAMELFNRMRQECVQPNEVTYLSILKACASPSALKWGKEVHACIRHGGLESDVRVGTALLKMYAKCGCMKEARRAFEELTNRNIITWNVMIGAYAECGCGEEAYRLFLQMKQEGFKPDVITCVSILNACGSLGPLELVKEVQRHVLDSGFASDLRVGTALVHMYANNGSIDDARAVFDKMEERDVITWNIMIGGLAQHRHGREAYELFLRMQREGCAPNAITYVSIMNTSASAGALEWMKEVHSHALGAGLASDLRVGSALIHMYLKYGCLDDARLVFDRMEERNLITWTTMIGAHAESGCGEEAYRLFQQMNREGVKPNAITYVSILNACASAGALEWVKEVHRHALEAGFESDLRVGNALIHMYANSGGIDDARAVFDRMEERDVITWNIIIGGLAHHGHGREAYELFLRMQREGCAPNAITYMSILNACASAGALEWVKKVHSHALEAGLASDLRVGTALVHMYANSGCLDDARLVFERMEERNVITWNVMIGAYAESGRGEEAHELLLRMQGEGCVPNAITYVSILNAYASAGALEWVKEVHRHALEAGFESDLRVGNALIHMYSKSGSIGEARMVFDSMEERDVITWNIMIGGLAQHGCGHEALEMFKNMNEAGVKPDGTSFVSVLSACSHAGLVDDGRRLFVAMTRDYGIEPTVVHFSCMVDLLGRAGHLEEAKLFISDMSVEPDVATWGALLGACRTHGNVELGELAAKELLMLEPNHAGTYVLLSNIYAAAGKWDQVSLMRSMMQQRGIRKEPGRSWIEVDNKIHRFVVGDTSHPEAKEIYAELNRLTERIKAEGYKPDTQLVLQNIDEEDKELSLCSHSEKLAIAYGLMCIPYGKPIRVYKNLRVCSDCHTATKFISKVTGREIVARDANRFHHFKDGVCSCGDYW